MTPRKPILRFRSERIADPLAPYPTVRWRDRPYNLALTDTILMPFLAERGPRAATAALQTAQGAFRATMPEAARLGDGAVVAVLAVTANLQRTIDAVARSPEPSGLLSRNWCGFAPTPIRRERTVRSARPAHAARPDLRPIARLLQSSCAELERQSRAALESLREELRAGRIFPLEDFPAFTSKGRESSSTGTPPCTRSSPCLR